MDLNEALKQGRNLLEKAKINPREARLLLAFVLNIKKEELLLKKEISFEEWERYQTVLTRRVQGEPFAYLTGYKEFMKLDFQVDESVLIPREDTEVLVERVMQIVKEKQLDLERKGVAEEAPTIKILDMCTGSGCIAISLAKSLNNVEVTAIDINEKALNIAKKNAEKNGVKVNFILSDLFKNLIPSLSKYDVIVSNPPYIPTDVIPTLQKEVKREPVIALDGGKTGIDFYCKIIKEALHFLKENGVLAFEIGYNQGEVVKNLMGENGFHKIKVVKDFGENDRVVLGTVKEA